MGKKNDWDSPLDDDFDLDFDFDEYAEPKASGRKPAKDAAKLLSKAAKGSAQGAFNKTASYVERAMPNSFGAYREVRDLALGGKGLMSELNKDVSKTIDSLRTSSRRLLPNVKKLIPGGLYDKIDRALTVDERNVELDKRKQLQKERDDIVSSAISETFVRTQQIERAKREEDRINKVIDRQLSISQFETGYRHLKFITSFLDTSFTAYLKKSIELKYKHLFVAQDTLEATRAMSTIIETKLENIKHNTGLPDIQKLHGVEGIKSAMYNKIFGSITDSFGKMGGGWSQKILKNIKSNYIDQAKSGLEQFAFMGDQLSDGVEMMRDMEDMMPGPKESDQMKIGGFLLNMLGEKMGSKFAKKHLKPIIQKGMPLFNIAENITGNSREKMMLYLAEMARKFEYDPTFGPIFENILPSLSGGVKVNNSLLEKGSMATPFDKFTRQSIVEIIPGWLSKIAKNTKDLVTGKNTEEEVYDVVKRDFVTVSSFRKNMTDHIYGDKNDRSSYGTKGLGIIAAAHSSKNTKINFDKIKKDIAIFLENHVLTNRLLKPIVIKNFSENEMNGEMYEEDYIDSVFDGIEDKQHIATVISNTIFNTEGKIDTDILSAINDSIIEKMRRDNYKSKFVDLFEVQGYRRYFKDDMDKYGNISKASILKNRLSEIGTVSGKRDISYEGQRYLKTLIERSKLNRNLMDTGIAGNTSMFQTGSIIGNLLEKGIIDEEQAQKILENFGDDLTGIDSPDSPFIESPLSNSFGGSSNTNNKTFNKNINKRSKVVNIHKTYNSLNVKDTESIDILNRIHEAISKDKESSPVESNTDLLNTIKDTFVNFAKEKIDIDYTLLDYIIQIHQKVKMGDSVTSEDKNKMFLLDKLGAVSGSLSGKLKSGINYLKNSKVKNLLKSSWKKVASSTKGIYQTLDKSSLIRTGIGYGMMGPLGAFLGYDSKDGFRRTKEVFNTSKNILGGLLKSGKDKLSDTKNKLLFIDIYRADNIIAGEPLLSAKLQENKEVIFNDGEIIYSSYMINRPVISLNDDKKTYISEDDLKVGLVDVNGKPLNKLNYLKDKFNDIKSGSKIKDFLSKHKGKLLGGGAGFALGGPIGALFGSLLGNKFSLDKIKNLASMKNISGLLGLLAGGPLGGLLGYGAGALGGKTLSSLKGILSSPLDYLKSKGGALLEKLPFGSKILDKVTDISEEKSSTKVKLIKSQFKLINDHLQKIEKNTRRKTVSGDSDGDGDRDGGFEDLKGKRKSLREKFGLGVGRTTEKMKGILGDVGTILGKIPGLGKFFPGAAGAGGTVLGTAGEIAGGTALGVGAGAAAKKGLMSRAGGLLARGGSALGRGALSLGRLGLSGAALIPGAASAAWGATTAGLGAVAGTVTGVLAAIPVAGWIALGVLAVGAGAYGVYKYMKSSEGSNLLLKERIKIYKISSLDDVDHVRKLENRINEFMIKEEGPLTDKEINKYLSRFKIRVGERNREMFKDWLAHSFIPQFGAFLKVIESFGKQYKDMKKIDKEDKDFESIKSNMIKSMSSVKTSGPLFSDLLNTTSDKEDKEEEKDKQTDIKDSEKKTTPVAKAINSVDKKQEVDYRKPEDIDKPKLKQTSIETYKPKDSLYQLIESSNDKQLVALNKIYDEIKLLRVLTENKFKEEKSKSIFDSLSESLGESVDSIKSMFSGSSHKNNQSTKDTFTKDVLDASKWVSMVEQVPEDYMLATSLIESRGGKNTRNTKFPNIKGPWQITPGTAAFMKLHPGTMNDPRSNAQAAARYYKWLRSELKRQGIPVTDENIYLAHQQGPAGAVGLYRARNGGPISSDLRNNMNNNGGVGMSADQFINFVHGKYNSALNTVKHYKRTQRDIERKKIEKMFQDSLPQTLVPNHIEELMQTTSITPIIDIGKKHV